jgi:hypothetical protein
MSLKIYLWREYVSEEKYGQRIEVDVRRSVKRQIAELVRIASVLGKQV